MESSHQCGKDISIIKHKDLNNLPRKHATISFVVITNALRVDRLIDLFMQLTPLKDELVVILDNADVSVKDILSKYADKVVCIPGKGSLEAYIGDIFWHCTQDWIFRVDDDETLNPDCSRELLQHYVSNRNITSYWIPTRWYINKEEYICTEPWLPDYHLRLFRNEPGIITLPSGIHQHLGVAGNSERINDLYLCHWNLVFDTREKRMEKVDHYNKLLPENGNDAYYLYEDQSYDIIKEHITSDKGPSKTSRVQIPDILKAGLSYIIEVRLYIENEHAISIINNNDNVYASYHWYGEDKTLYQWDNSRVAIPRNCMNGQYRILMPIQLPLEPGVYYFQVDIVEESVQWFSNSGIMIMELVRVEIE